MVPWLHLSSTEEIDALAEKSGSVPCLIFKHSTRCSISTLAKLRLEQGWCFPGEAVQPFLVDLITYRRVSDYISHRFGVKHESPQVLIVKNGRSIHDASHLDIDLREIGMLLSGFPESGR